MSEYIVILDLGATDQQLDAVPSEIAAYGGVIAQAYTPGVLIVEGEDLDLDLTGVDGIAEVTEDAVQDVDLLDLDEITATIVDAWNFGQSDDYDDLVANPPNLGANWGDFGFDDCTAHLPTGFHITGSLSSASRFLIGTVAVGLFLVDGPSGSSTVFSQDEIKMAIWQSNRGCQFLRSIAPAGANLKFVTDFRKATIAVPPLASLTVKETDFEAREAPWRDPALQQFGLATGSPGVDELNQQLLSRTWPGGLTADWAYTVFFTKYNTAHHCYALEALGKVVVAYHYVQNGFRGIPPVGLDGLDMVFAHGSCHVFGAMDEYTDSNCSVLALGGFLEVPNANCEVNNPFSQGCVMKHYSRQICSATFGQVGWLDSDGDGILDPVDPNRFGP